MQPQQRQAGTRPCKFLRSKEMYYATLADTTGEFGGQTYWCDCTQDAIGPDDKIAEAKECSPERSCYRR